MVDYSLTPINIQQPDVGNILRTVAAVRGAENQNALFALQKQKLDEASADRTTVRNALSRLASGDTSARTQLIGTPGGADILKNLDAEKLHRVQEVAALSHSVLAAPAQDRPAVYQAMRSLAQQRGLDVSQLPEQYDPSVDAHLQAAVGLGMTLDQQLKAGELRKPTVIGEGGTAIDNEGNVIARGAPKSYEPKTVTTADGVFVLNRDGSLGGKLGGAPNATGKTMDERDRQTVLHGDPSTPEYAAAYANLAAPRMVQTDKGMVSVTPDVSWARPPARGGAPTGPAPAVPATGGPQAPAGQPTISVVPGTERGPKFSADQSTAAGFANRISAANSTLDQLESGGYSPTNSRDVLAGNVPGGNFIRSEKGQQYDQAKRDFITAVLRKESGAAISAGEFVTEDKKYFPQPGDSGPVIAQKRAARERAFQSMIAQSGEAYKTMFGGGKASGTKTANAAQEYDYDPVTKTLKPRAP